MITEHEIYSGATTPPQDQYWRNFLERIIVLPFDQSSCQLAVEINNRLKRKSKQIEMADLFIASIAMSNDMPFATLNKKHFDRIDGLNLIG